MQLQNPVRLLFLRLQVYINSTYVGGPKHMDMTYCGLFGAQDPSVELVLYPASKILSSMHPSSAGFKVAVPFCCRTWRRRRLAQGLSRHCEECQGLSKPFTCGQRGHIYALLEAHGNYPRKKTTHLPVSNLQVLLGGAEYLQTNSCICSCSVITVMPF